MFSRTWNSSIGGLGFAVGVRGSVLFDKVYDKHVRRRIDDVFLDIDNNKLNGMYKKGNGVF